MTLEREMGSDFDVSIETPPPSLLAEQRLKPSRLVGRLAKYLEKLRGQTQITEHPALARFLNNQNAAADPQSDFNVELHKREGLGLVLEDDEEAEFEVIVEDF